jgi:hypothetical protein
MKLLTQKFHIYKKASNVKTLCGIEKPMFTVYDFNKLMGEHYNIFTEKIYWRRVKCKRCDKIFMSNLEKMFKRRKNISERPRRAGYGDGE